MGSLQTQAIFLLTIALISCINQTLVSGSFFWQRDYVHILNHLEPSGEILQVHCKSADDDLGLHKIGSNQMFSWSFHPNFWETTLFFCGAAWSHGRLSFTAFEDLTSLLDDGCGGRNCTWQARVDGFYLFNTNDRKFHFRLKWDKP